MAVDPRVRRYLLRGLAVFGVLIALWAGFSAFRVWRAWSNVERIEFDVTEARDAIAEPGNPFLGQEPPADPDEPDEPDSSVTGNTGEIEVIGPDFTIPTAVTINRNSLQAYLLIGTDQRPQFGQSQRADVILLVILPADDSDPILMSIPRDLYLPNPCTGGLTRINATLNGCGTRATGPELLGIAIEDFTGVAIDHFAVIDFEGFKQVIDRVGGVEICIDNQVRDSYTDPKLDLPAGCTLADGGQTLAWVRSRHTQELVNGSWRTMPGVNDLERNRRQQELLLEALTKLKAFRSVTEFSALVEDLADAFIIDDNLSMGDAIGLAWDLRDIQLDDIQRPVIPVRDYVTAEGAYVLVPQATFTEVVIEVWPGVIDALAGG